MNTIRTSLANLQQNVQQTYQNASTQVSQSYQNTRQAITDARDGLSSAVQENVNAARDRVQRSAEATVNFVNENSQTIFYVGCIAVNAALNPTGFVLVTVATVVIRIELTHQLRELCQRMLRDEVNPFLQWRARDIISQLDLGLATVAVIDAIALGTIYYSNSIIVNGVPFLGAVAAGSSIAKWIMTHYPV